METEQVKVGLSDPKVREDYELFGHSNSSVLSLLYLGLFYFVLPSVLLFKVSDMMDELVVTSLIIMAVEFVLLCIFATYKANQRQDSLTGLVKKWIPILLTIGCSVASCLMLLYAHMMMGSSNMYCGALIFALITPLVFNTIFRSMRAECAYLSWALVVAAVGLRISKEMSYNAYELLLVYAPLSLIIIFETRKQNYNAFVVVRRHQWLLDEFERVASETQATEMRHMIANVAHDLKTPLSGFMHGIELITDVVDSAQELEALLHSHSGDNEHRTSPKSAKLRIMMQSIRTYITDIKNINNFMLMTINRCIDYTKASKGMKLVPKVESFHLLETIRLPLNCVNSIQNVQIQFTEHLIDKNVYIMTDKQWLQENILCLLSNAVKYSNKGTVTLNLHVVSSLHILTKEQQQYIKPQIAKYMDQATNEEEVIRRVFSKDSSAGGGNSVHSQSHHSESVPRSISISNTAHSQTRTIHVHPHNKNHHHHHQNHSNSNTSTHHVHGYHHPRHHNHNNSHHQHQSSSHDNDDCHNDEKSSENNDASSNINHQQNLLQSLLGGAFAVGLFDDGRRLSTFRRSLMVKAFDAQIHPGGGSNGGDGTNNDPNGSNSNTKHGKHYHSNNSNSSSSRSRSSHNSILSRISMSLTPNVSIFDMLNIGTRNSSNAINKSTTNVTTDLENGTSTGDNKTSEDNANNHHGTLLFQAGEGGGNHYNNNNNQGDNHSEASSNIEHAIWSASYLIVEVDDNGIGISQDLMQHLFAPFKQAQRMAGGTGLGLFSLAKRVEALKGFYGVQKRRDNTQGSLFWFAIPYKPDKESQLFAERYMPVTTITAPVGGGGGIHNNLHVQIHPIDANPEIVNIKMFTPQFRTSFLNANVGISSSMSSTLDDTNNNNNIQTTHSINMNDSRDNTNTNEDNNSGIMRSKNALMNNNGGGTQLKILLVDDSSTIQKMTAMMLRKHGHIVHQAYNGAEAVDKLKYTENESKLLLKHNVTGITIKTRSTERDHEYSEDTLVSVRSNNSLSELNKSNKNNNNNNINLHERSPSPSKASDATNNNNNNNNNNESEIPYYDVILMDLQMPIMDGMEATRRIREMETNYPKSSNNEILFHLNSIRSPVLSPQDSEDHLQINNNNNINNNNSNSSNINNSKHSTPVKSPAHTGGGHYSNNSNNNRHVTSPSHFHNNNNNKITMNVRTLSHHHHFIIGLSANSDVIAKQGAFEAGVDDFIDKPLNMKVFNDICCKYFNQ